MSIAISRIRMQEKEKEADLAIQSEILYNTLMNSVSHELRTPLAAIAGSAGAIQDENIRQNPDTLKEYARQIEDATEDLNYIVENLLDMTRLESGHFKLRNEWHDLSDLLGVTLSRLQKKSPMHPIIVEIADPFPLLKIDFVLLEQAFYNLLMNAIVHTKQGTTIWIRSSYTKKTCTILFEDNGGGISEEHISQIFNKFYKFNSQGTGLGLSITQRIINLHNGNISAHLNSLGGLTFKIVLPVEKQPDSVHE